jgi:aspartyl-tRNA(Asn)/glutamyl-tRNA(Gln) amidotransferase subunit B
MRDGWSMVIGLEVHAELATATKLFCGCRNVFGQEPNSNCCPVCLGLPGSLPVLNEEAVRLAARLGLALGCEVRPSSFHRKNYFYPDQAKDYQISQYDEPINANGELILPDGFLVGIERAHLEEDTGKTSHVGSTGRIHGSDYSLVDYNRSGVPLVEIVSRPDIRNGDQARAYVAELRGVLVATGASDGRMEEGSMRVDANVSVRQGGEAAEFGTRCEIKNLNSLRSLGRAIDYEAERQIQLLEGGEIVHQETRHWDEDRGVTVTMRSKEEAYDYRYFPEPDLVPISVSEELLASLSAGMPMLPAQRRDRLRGLFTEISDSLDDQLVTTVDQGLDDLVLAAVQAGADPVLVAARVSNEVAGAPREQQTKLDSAAFTATLVMEHSGALSATQSKKVLAQLLAEGGEPAAIAAALGFEQLGDDALGQSVAELVAANPDEWGRYASGEEKLAQFFIGLVMKATKGQANGKAVIAELARLRDQG